MPDTSAPVGQGAAAPWSLLQRLAVLLACLVPLCFPADIPWYGDQVILIGNALRCNETGHLAVRGLIGMSSYPYGPMPTWFYQALLALTHDLPTIVLAKAALSTALTAIALCWLAKLYRINLLFVAGVLCSYHLVFYSRLLWDNTFCIPLSALALASYFQFAQNQSRWALRGCVLCLLLLPLIHLMSLSLCAAIGLGLLWRWRIVMRDWLMLGSIMALVIVMHLPYLFTFARDSATHSMHTPSDVALWTLFGGWAISNWRVDYHLSTAWLDANVGLCAWLIGIVGSCLIGVSIFGLYRIARTGWGQANPVMDRESSFLLLVAIVLHGLASLFAGPLEHLHYFNAIWPVYFLALWVGLTHLVKPQYLGRACTALFAFYILSCTLIMLTLHRTGGTTNAFGPTLGAQMQALAELRDVKLDRITTGRELHRPSLTLLRKLDGADGTSPDARAAVYLPRKHREWGMLESVRSDK